MATIRKRGGKWQVQIRRNGSKGFSKTFNLRKHAEAWARQTEIDADRGDLPADPKALSRVTLGDLVIRYRDTVSCRKRCFPVERIVLSSFLKHPICSKKLSELATINRGRKVYH